MITDYLIIFILSFVVVIYIIIKALKEDAATDGNSGSDNGGGDWGRGETPPVIDLPPGISWPVDAPRGIKDDRPV
ncbi:hypothetical protein R9C00_26300 [Flammeovirgaceae bacterium SG7u.111]|nr:hypothetical protein [Flammeovirgaceae bacterium SG7u.132]WPO35211.1 hypothetical protein R9C00_26300 [Flammeovirgaceae bacterium SG7u.111]